jgi:hypothetical protein
MKKHIIDYYVQMFNIIKKFKNETKEIEKEVVKIKYYEFKIVK